MSSMGVGCKLMQDAGLKVWSTFYKENSLPKMLEGKAYSRCLRACLLTDTALHFTLLSGNDHSQENEENQIFEPLQTFNENEDVADFMDDGNIFDCLDNDDEQFFENNDFENDSDKSSASILIEKLKSNCDDNNGLMLFNEETVELLSKLYESLEKQEVSLDEVSNHPVVNSIEDIVGNLKFVQEVSCTGKLLLQFMGFISIIRMFIRAARTGNFELHIYSSKQMLPYLATAGHDKYAIAIRKYLQDIKNRVLAWRRSIKKVD